LLAASSARCSSISVTPDATLVLSSSAVVEKAEAVVSMIVEAYSSPNKTFRELRELMSNHAIDPLRAFSETCRVELQALQDQCAHV
jgi:hypothetical protein